MSWRDEDGKKGVTSKPGLKSRNSISLSTAEQIRVGSSASATYSPRLSDSDYQASCSTSSAPIQIQAEKHSDSEEQTAPPVKKKRGRPPLDDDFDSYSTPKISHVESTAPSNYNDQMSNVLDALSDDGSQGLHTNANSMLEQNMEITIEDDEDALHGQIIPKTERPDTPPTTYKPEYYDDIEDNPASPLEDPSDPASTSQVNILMKRQDMAQDMVNSTLNIEYFLF